MTDEYVDPVIVYGLKSSRDNEIRYVGQTTAEMTSRWSKHKRDAKAGKAVAALPEVLERVKAIAQAHAGLAKPDGVGRSVGQKR